MRASSFAGALLFAVMAGLGTVPFLLAAGSVVGAAWAPGLFALTAAVACLVAVAPSWRRSFEVGAWSALFAGVVALLAPTPIVAVLGAALLLAFGRSGFLFRRRPARAFLLELVLVGGGLAFVRALAEPSLWSQALAVWGFFLIQSLFFLFGGASERSETESELDGFEASRRRALSLMEDA